MKAARDADVNKRLAELEKRAHTASKNNNKVDHDTTDDDDSTTSDSSKPSDSAHLTLKAQELRTLLASALHK